MQKRLRDDQINEENANIADFLKADTKLYYFVNMAKIIDSQEEFNFIIDNTTNESDELKLLKSVYNYFKQLCINIGLNSDSNFDDFYDCDESSNENDEYARQHITTFCIPYSKDINLFEAIVFKYIETLLERIKFIVKINYNMKISLSLDYETDTHKDFGYVYISLNIYEKRN